jgi:hypothetical protein
MKKLSYLIIISMLLTISNCKTKTTSQLSVIVTDEAFINPNSDGTSCKNHNTSQAGGATKPYARLPNFSYSWNGSNRLQVTDVRVRLTGPSIVNGEQVISITMEELNYMMCDLATCGDGVLDIVAPPTTTPIASPTCGLIFGGIQLKDSKAQGFVSATVRVYGNEIDSAGNSIPVQADAFVNLINNGGW